MAHSLIVDLLAERPERDLRELREQAVAVRQRVSVEIEQIDEALAKQGRKRPSRAARPSPSPSPSRPSPAPAGATRQRILRIIRDEGQTSPAEIVALSKQQGKPLGKSSVYNMLKALTDTGVIVRVSEGVYELASANGSSPSKPSTDAPSVGSEGYGRESALTPNDGLAVTTAPSRA
jgi:Ferric uptake regulator family